LCDVTFTLSKNCVSGSVDGTRGSGDRVLAANFPLQSRPTNTKTNTNSDCKKTFKNKVTNARTHAIVIKQPVGTVLFTTVAD